MSNEDLAKMAAQIAAGLYAAGAAGSGYVAEKALETARLIAEAVERK